MQKVLEKQKRVICYLLIVVVFILMGNTNNIPEAFVGRIFKPITIDRTTIYYSGLITIGVLYYALKKLNMIKENKFINTGFRRIVVVVVLLECFQLMWGWGIQFYKGFSKDLNSIYLDREKTSMEFNRNEDEVFICGTISLENCGNKLQGFKIKIKVPSFIEDNFEEEYVTINEKYSLHPKEEKEFVIHEAVESKGNLTFAVYSCNSFEYVLFNKEDEAIFYGTVFEYDVE